MTDREKVIKAIETHINDSVGCDDCTYENDGWCTTRVLTDALALLKEYDNLEKRHEILVNHADTMLAMLKERNEKIAVLKRFIEQMPKPTKLLDVFCNGYAKVVRCKDCKNAVVYDGNEVICTHIDSNGNDKHSIDWFCADGESLKLKGEENGKTKRGAPEAEGMHQQR